MKLFRAIKDKEKTLVGTMSDIARELKVSRQAIHKAYKHVTKCKGYAIVFYVDIKTTSKKSVRARLTESIDLLKRARLIIEEENEDLSNRGEYSNIGIIEDIDRFLKI